MDRTIQPAITKDFKPQLMALQRYEFANGCVVFNFPFDIFPVVKINFIFPAGSIYQNAPLVATYTGKMLFEGTTSKTQQEIAKEFEIAGALVDVYNDKDYAYITVRCTTQRVNDVLILIHHLLTESIFPEKELFLLAQNDKQEYLINLLKINFLARRQLLNLIFGEKHPYTSFATETDFDSVNRDWLKKFSETYFQPQHCTIFWTGMFNESSQQLTEELFGKLNKSHNIEQPAINIPFKRPTFELITVDNAKQTAIYIGRILPGIKHPDYFNLKIVNTILGGYFGSRLMKNIREEKGYTYGIHSYIENYKHASILIVASEVKAEHTNDAIDEINKEIERLCVDDVSVEELELVKNYMIGSLMQKIDGPFAQSGFYEMAFLHEVDANVLLKNFLENIRQISPKIIKQIAQKYITPDQLFYSLAGKINND